MNLTTHYLGFQLPHPLMPGASPMAWSLDTVRRLEDAGAAAIVLHSLFEEQIAREQVATSRAIDTHSESFAEALSYFPEPPEFELGPDDYLEQIGKIKAAVACPVIASLNGLTAGGWLKYARLMTDAGADALELNFYYLATDPHETAPAIEARTLEVVRAVKKEVAVPLAVKLSPFYTALAHFVRELEQAGADGVIVFNRFYQPDIDPEQLEVRRVNLSDSSELLLRLRWLAILSGQVRGSLACSGGVHAVTDVVKAVMAGAHAVQLVSSLLRWGPEYLGKLRAGLEAWLGEHEYESLAQMRGSMSLAKCPDPKAYERANYMHVLQSWRD